MLYTRFRHACLALFFISALLFSSVHAQTPTPAQIEQFKRLPASEQQALARSLGIDLNDFDDLLGSQGAGSAGSSLVEPITGQRQAPQNNQLTTEEDFADLNKEDEDAPLDEALKPFGYDIFELGGEAFTPATDIPVPSDYVLGPGDTLQVQLYGKQSSSLSLSLSRDGNVQFPDIGPIALAGLNYESAVNKINEIVSEQMIGIKASVTMGPLRTVRIFVLGEVNIPGSYVVGSLSTMTNAIFASGGVSEIGSLRNIQLKRAGKIITTLDLYDLLLNGDTSGDSRLLPGDVIFVPPVGRTAGVSGAVKRPAIYELKNEKTAQDLLDLAGGLLPTSYLPSSKIERVLASGEKTFVEVNLQKGFAGNFVIKDADTLKVSSSLDNVVDTVSVRGHVKREEELAWKKGIRFSEIIKSPESLLPLPDLNLAIIEREIKETREIEVISFSPQKAFSFPNSDADPELKTKDKIYLFGFEEERSETLVEIVEKLKLQTNYETQQKIVRITGSIRFPGEYPLTQNMSAKDLVQLAGGFIENATARNAEITRHEINSNREHVVLHIQTDLNQDDTLLVAGDSLMVKQIPLWRDKEVVSLVGEFVHPGDYPILPGETLIDVIRRAGGLTPQAYPAGAIFSRAELRRLEEERLEDLKEEVEADIVASQLETSETRKNIDVEQADKILDNLEGVQALGRMVIDLEKILTAPDDFNFQLEDGDSINVPRFKPSITVVGEVQYSTSHFYDADLSLKDYLNRSGGLKRNADKNRIYVIKANGEVFKPKGTGWFKANRGQLHPGDTIVVPLDTKRVDRLTLWASVTSIMYQAAVGIAAIGGL